MTDDKKPPKRYVTIVSQPAKMIIGDPDLSDEERAEVRERETRMICPLCRNGLITNEQYKLWLKFQLFLKTNRSPPDSEPEGAA